MKKLSGHLWNSSAQKVFLQLRLGQRNWDTKIILEQHLQVVAAETSVKTSFEQIPTLLFYTKVH